MKYGPSSDDNELFNRPFIQKKTYYKKGKIMSKQKAKVKIDIERKIGDINPNIYGQFLSRRKWVTTEALYNPKHPDAGDDGLRKKVFEAIENVKTPIVRWPGGCTGTSYYWKDGIGPKKERENTIDAHFGYDVNNGFGTAEFVDFCRKLGAEPQINLSTGFAGLQEAIEWIEYCNYNGNSKWANLRRKHGYDKPFNVKYWQIGNEDYANWEINQKTAYQNAMQVRQWAKAIKKMDSNLKVLGVGGPPNNKDWDVELLNNAWEYLDYITAHRYWHFNEEQDKHNYDEIAAVGYFEERIMHDMGGLINLVARDKCSTRKPKLAYTEWNVNGNLSEMSPEWKPAKVQFRMADILAVGGFISAMQRQCNTVTLANFAQTINVVGMLFVTDEVIIKETIYWALYLARHFSGNIAVDNYVVCDSYKTHKNYRGELLEIENVPYLDVSTTVDEKMKKLYICFINRHIDESMTVDLSIMQTVDAQTIILHELWHEDPYAKNTIENPDNIVPQTKTMDIDGSKFEMILKPHSYTIVEINL